MTAPGGDARLAGLREKLGRTGIWMPAPGGAEAEWRAVATEIERHGFGSAWVGGGNAAPDSFAQLAWLLEGSGHLVVATGIASIWAWEPGEMRAVAEDLARRFPGRFVLGLGVSHAPLVESLGQTYERPLEKMRQFLDGMGEPAGEGDAGTAGEQPACVLAALGPRMLELARDGADGAHPYFVPVAHTAFAREILGPGPLLVPEQAVVLEQDRPAALAAARAYMSMYLKLPNYVSNLHRLGFTPEDTGAGGSGRLVDAIVPHGPSAVAARVREHLDAGADHVVVQPLDAGGKFSMGLLAPLAEALAGI
jgi:probable F420-dependent oxidoreductase